MIQNGHPNPGQLYLFSGDLVCFLLTYVEDGFLCYLCFVNFKPPNGFASSRWSHKHRLLGYSKASVWEQRK
jgi:hypothetical protein